MSGQTIITKLGGVRRAAERLGVPRATVGYWNTVNRIPAHRQQAVIDGAARHGIPLSPADFFDAAPVAGSERGGSAQHHQQAAE
jgi:hypothetical protein